MTQKLLRKKIYEKIVSCGECTINGLKILLIFKYVQHTYHITLTYKKCLDTIIICIFLYIKANHVLGSDNSVQTILDLHSPSTNFKKTKLFYCKESAC